MNKELNRIKLDTDQTIMLLRDRIDSLEYSEKQRNDNLSELQRKHQSELDVLRDAKLSLEQQLAEQERAVSESRLAASLA